MYILRIEHAVMSYPGWKKAFDADPIGRKGRGVQTYKVLRLVDDPGMVEIDLEFDSLAQAEDMYEALLKIWGEVEGTIIHAPRARILEVVESREV